VIVVQEHKYIIFFLMVILLGAAAAEDSTALSMDEATDIAQVVADTYTEYTGTKWVALSPVEVYDDITYELIGYFYLITNNLDAGKTTIKGLESEVEKANIAYPLRGRLESSFASREQEDAYYHFCDNYFTLIIASEYTEYPIINLEKCGFEMALRAWIIIQRLNKAISDTDPSNSRICNVTYIEKYDTWNCPVRYLKYIVESRLSREQLTIMDGFAEVSMERYDSFIVFLDIYSCLESIGLLK
jgi:hypothetical protein